MEIDKMDLLKRQVTEYVGLKADLKTITERKNLLEKTICSAMDEFGVDTLQLPDGSNLNYRVKESLVLAKDKTKTRKEKE
jgi:hypothetical protein